VVAHLPLGGRSAPGVLPTCRDVLRIAGRARQVAAVPRRNPVAALAARSSGVEEAFVVPATGRYTLWLAGSRRSAADVYVDGRRVVRATAHLDRAEQYGNLGDVALGRGLRTIRVRFDPGLLEPGTDAPDYGFGPLVVAPADTRRNVTSFEPTAAMRLCARTLDWVEALR
jgi:hypothetical protein